MRYVMVLLSLVLPACQSSDDHTHGPGGRHAQSGQGRPAIEYTVWTDKTELFVEFPALIAGQQSRFAAHFTVLDGHKAVTEGSVTVSLIKGDKGIRQTIDAPSSPGIFSPTLQPTQAGVLDLVFDIRTPDLSDRIVIKNVKVYEALRDAIDEFDGKEADGGSITFLKEQAWKMEFQTVQAKEKEIFEVIHTSGKWLVSPADYRALIANTAGRVSFQKKNLTKGSFVKKGERLLALESSGLSTNNLGAEYQKARANFEQARSEFDRKKTLLDSRIISKADFEQVERRYQVAKTEYEILAAGYSAGGKQIIAPFNGYIKSLQVNNGQFVEQGVELLTVTSSNISVLAVDVSSHYAKKLQDIRNIWFKMGDDWVALDEIQGEVVSVSRSIDETNPMLTVSAQIAQGIDQPEGAFTKVDVVVGKPLTAVVVPEAALMEDYGKYSLVVQLSGESFEMRNVTIGKRNGHEVEILTGLTSGEVVVTKGAFQVKMASMSGAAPAHGHAH